MSNEIKAVLEFIGSVGPEQALFMVTLAALGLVGFALYVLMTVVTRKSTGGRK